MDDAQERNEVRLGVMESKISSVERRFSELLETHRQQLQSLLRSRGEHVSGGTSAGGGMGFSGGTEATPFKRVFHAQITGYSPTSGTPYAWKEMYMTSAGVMEAFTSGRRCPNFTSANAAREINGWRYIHSGTNVEMIEYPNMTKTVLAFAATVPAVAASALNFNQGLAFSSASKGMAWMLVASCS